MLNIVLKNKTKETEKQKEKEKERINNKNETEWGVLTPQITPCARPLTGINQRQRVKNTLVNMIENT